MSCNDCKNWVYIYGCKCMDGDTGEILHYYKDAEKKCREYTNVKCKSPKKLVMPQFTICTWRS